MNRLVAFFFITITTLTIQQSQAQVSTLGGKVVTTAVPFLRITPDARSGGMGDVGVSSSPDLGALYLNPSKIAFLENDFGFALSYVPWLRNLQVNDIYLASLGGYYKLDDRQALAMSLRYFSLGNITFTNEFAVEIGDFKPNEFAIDAHYARKLSDYFSLGISLRFIYSNLATDQVVNGLEIKPGKAAAGDVSLYFRKPVELGGDLKTDISFGANISNIGSKITYTESAVKDFIPTNLGLGFGWEFDFDEHNELNFFADLNKLLVPSPDTADADNNGIFDYREKSPISGMFSSFGDASGGFKEELQEIMYSVGLEYWYDRQFAVRLGYFNEHSTKGSRKFLTAGLGVKYSVFGLNFSYLIPTTSQRDPLDNTMRFTLLFDFAKGGLKSNQPIDDEPVGF